MLTHELFTEEPIELLDDDVPRHKGKSGDSWISDDFTIDDLDDIEGYHWYPCAWVMRADEKDALLSETDDLVHQIITRTINRAEAAHEADWNLNRLIHMRLDLDLRMGELLTHLRKKKETYLGHRSIGTFAVEHLSFSGRLASEMMHNYEALSGLPLSKKAYLRKELRKSALRHLSRVMTPDNEAEWILKAQCLSISMLEKEVKRAIQDGNGASQNTGEACDSSTDKVDCLSAENNTIADRTECAPDLPSEESGEERKGVMMYFNVSPKLAPVWDFALQHFRDTEHYNGPISGFVEALLANFLASGRGADHTQSTSDTAALPIFYRCHMKDEGREDSKETVKGASIDDSESETQKSSSLSDDESCEMPWMVICPPSFDEIPDDLRGIAEKLKYFASIRQFIDVAMGKLLWAMRDWWLYNFFDCCCIEEYGEMRCDLSKLMVYRLMKLAQGFRRHPLIREAFEAGFISREQARLILPIVNEKNEWIWIDYAAHAPTVTLREEVERCSRIMEYDLFAARSYNILPGFRYITDDRFHELTDEMQEIIKKGSWYKRYSPESCWPLEEDDERCIIERDRRLEEPWRYFDDVEELRAYEAEVTEKKSRIQSRGSRMNMVDFNHSSGSPQCASDPEPGIPTHRSENLPCASDGLSGKDTTVRSNVQDEKIIAEVREICTIPDGVSPAEIFLLDILADDSGPAAGASTMKIRFFLPEELHELWNFTVMLYLQRTGNTATVNAGGMNIKSIHELPPREPELSEGFIAALLRDYLDTERLHFKISHHYTILKRDHFKCQVPGCNCRRNLHIHHIIWRSKGRNDLHWNLITLCSQHHLHILHGLMALKIEGTAPYNLAFTFGAADTRSDGYKEPFLIYKNGRRVLKTD